MLIRWTDHRSHQCRESLLSLFYHALQHEPAKHLPGASDLFLRVPFHWTKIRLDLGGSRHIWLSSKVGRQLLNALERPMDSRNLVQLCIRDRFQWRICGSLAIYGGQRFNTRCPSGVRQRILGKDFISWHDLAQTNWLQEWRRLASWCSWAAGKRANRRNGGFLLQWRLRRKWFHHDLNCWTWRSSYQRFWWFNTNKFRGSWNDSSVVYCGCCNFCGSW